MGHQALGGQLVRNRYEKQWFESTPKFSTHMNTQPHPARRQAIPKPRSTAVGALFWHLTWSLGGCRAASIGWSGSRSCRSLGPRASGRQRECEMMGDRVPTSPMRHGDHLSPACEDGMRSHCFASWSYGAFPTLTARCEGSVQGQVAKKAISASR